MLNFMAVVVRGHIDTVVAAGDDSSHQWFQLTVFEVTDELYSHFNFENRARGPYRAGEAEEKINTNLFN